MAHRQLVVAQNYFILRRHLGASYLGLQFFLNHRASRAADVTNGTAKAQGN
jgi:hypothetical protein